MEPTALAVAAADAVVKEALKTGTAPLLNAVGKAGKKASDNLVVLLQLGFHDYMKVSYEKCRLFKSILPPSQPRDILNNYIHADIKIGQRTIPDFALFEEPTKGKSFVLTGLAGSGKSMLLKYFVASYFENPRGPTPLFVELRRLNKFTSRNLLSFIRTDCVSSKNQISEEQFSIALRGEVFSLILDGFDEVNDEFKGEVQDQILEIRRLYPDLMIAISSRPDARFRGWTNFSVYEVQELDKEKCIRLIDSFEYDSGIKKRFKDRVQANLWETHRSFLEYPLLVSIMLLTYEEFADIPNRQHVFYRQAFDTLFVKHDSDKEQYQRVLKTGLQLEEFRIAFAAFCGLTYLKQKISFDEDSLINFVSKASKYGVNSGELKAPFNESKFVDDLFNAVCMLQHDGLETTFVHRSFQEYFAAYFAIRLPSDKMSKVLDAFSDRFNDQSMAMAFDMSREIVEQSWSISKIETLISKLSDVRKTSIERFSIFTDHITISNDDVVKPNGVKITSLHHGSMLSLCEAIGKLYSIKIGVEEVFSFFYRLDQPIYIDKVLDVANSSLPNYDIISSVYRKESGGDSLEMASENQWWFSILGGDELVDRMVAALEKARRAIKNRDRKADAIIEELL